MADVAAADRPRVGPDNWLGFVEGHFADAGDITMRCGCRAFCRPRLCGLTEPHPGLPHMAAWKPWVNEWCELHNPATPEWWNRQPERRVRSTPYMRHRYARRDVTDAR